MVKYKVNKSNWCADYKLYYDLIHVLHTLYQEQSVSPSNEYLIKIF